VLFVFQIIASNVYYYVYHAKIYYAKIVAIVQNVINPIVPNVEYYALNVIKNIALIV
jgi:hypothetical protein